jgi:hypothetical protein
MTKPKPSNTKNETEQNDSALQSETDRESKIMNAIANTSVILMSTMMDAFTQVMVNTTGAIASGMAGALAGREAEEKVSDEVTQKLPEVNEKMKALISDMKKDIYSQMRQKRKDMERLLSDPVLEVGLKIIERYDFKLPKLTQQLDDNTLAKYSQLLASKDSRFAEMFKALVEWMNSLPKPPKRNSRALKSNSPRSSKPLKGTQE